MSLYRMMLNLLADLKVLLQRVQQSGQGELAPFIFISCTTLVKTGKIFDYPAFSYTNYQK